MRVKSKRQNLYFHKGGTYIVLSGRSMCCFFPLIGIYVFCLLLSGCPVSFISCEVYLVGVCIALVAPVSFSFYSPLVPSSARTFLPIFPPPSPPLPSTSIFPCIIILYEQTVTFLDEIYPLCSPPQ